ncbi:MAG: glycoside hydrolase family 88 protein [Alphaproteobacteria bacterium]|nr:glycoside hydrolase family 88 protein [Alphaproteobacteria bacterium]
MLLLLLACAEPQPETTTRTLDTLETAQRLAEQGQETWPADAMPLDWMQTVWGYGLLRLDAAAPDRALTGYLRDWMQDHLGRFEGEDARGFVSSDSMSPSILASALMARGEGDFSLITQAATDYLAVAPRTRNGAIQHWGEGSPFGVIDQVWIDSQFMFGLFMLREYERTEDAAWADQFATQYLAFSELCRDPGDQLYRHAWDDAEGVNIPEEAVYWARGNSWVLISAAEALSVLPEEHADYDAIQSLYIAHAEALLATQAESGAWLTVLNSPYGDDPDNYAETSATALIAYGLLRGVDAGALDAAEVGPAVARATDFVLEHVEEKSGALVVEGTSFGTNPGDYDYYLSVAQLDDIILGVGAVVMLLAEVDGLEVEVTP